jgi:predicted metal-dependent HD superfamily phosphohydrolase
MQTNLEERWLRLWKALDPENENGMDYGLMYAKLAERYSEPHRAYHTLAHLEHCFAEYDEVRRLCENRFAVQLALWYHDAVYDPRANDNEKRSEELALLEIYEAGQDKSLGSQVRRHIHSTGHFELYLEYDSFLVVDIDLAILGQPEERFDEYERQVRAEYKWVSEEMFRKGRSNILQNFLNRPHVYRTPHFQHKYEQQARKNLTRSIHQLQLT